MRLFDIIFIVVIMASVAATFYSVSGSYLQIAIWTVGYGCLSYYLVIYKRDETLDIKQEDGVM